MTTWQPHVIATEAQPQISIIIKALNEEIHICACIASALRALKGLNGEVILVDSGSTDHTLEFAAGFPIEIVQLANPLERRCGIGLQLGVQHAQGEFVYILDGDMELSEAFLRLALDALEADTALAGVAGLVEERNVCNMQFRSRKDRNDEGMEGYKEWLGMGGLYRRTALESVGYASNRNLFAHEEQELGLRLASRGWKLKRISAKSVDHFGHTDSTMQLLVKRWRSGYLFGAGQIIRTSIGKPYFWAVVHSNLHNIVALGLWIMLLTGLALIPLTTSVIGAWTVATGTVLLQRLIRHENLSDSILCVLVWYVNAIALLVGFFMPQTDPNMPIQSRKITQSLLANNLLQHEVSRSAASA